MKTYKKALKTLALSLVFTFTFFACEEDFTSIDSGIDIGQNFTTNSEKYAVKAYTKRLEKVQTNNLPITLFGAYNDPNYGTTTSSFVSQLSPANTDFSPTFGDNVVLDSVVLTVPYFSSIESTDSENNSTYTLDSIYPNNIDELSPIKLSIYRNNYFLRDFSIDEDNLNESLNYYSDGSTSEGGQISTSQLESTLLYTDLSYKPSANQITLKDTDEAITSRLAPRLRVHLANSENSDDENPNTTVHQNLAYWKSLIIDKEGEEELSNSNNFLNYFRGLYFKAETISADGSMISLNTGNNANIQLFYTSETTDSETGEVTSSQNTYTITFRNTKVNFYNNQDFSINNGDDTNGDNTLFVKGGQGSLAKIELFNGDTEPGGALETFKNEFIDSETGVQKRLVNEAYLKVFVDQNMVNGNEPSRLYAFDMKNNTPIIDYFFDQSTTKVTHLAPLVEENNEGVSYKIRVTEHIKNIIRRDSLNLSIGLTATNNVTLDSGNLTYEGVDNNQNTVISTSSIIEPRGSILYGSTEDVPENVRLQLEIYYTEPDN